MEFKVAKNRLTFQEQVSFISNVGDSVFESKDGIIIRYLPENYDLYVRLAFAIHYLDYSTEGKSLEEVYNDCGKINMDQQLKDIDADQYNSIIFAIDEKIEFNKQKIFNNKKDSLDELLQSITSFINTMENKFKDVDVSSIDGLGQLGKKVKELSDTKLTNALVKEFAKLNDNKK